MLKSLFVSETRIDILWLFLNNFKRSYHLREISRIIDKNVNAARIEVNNLTKIKLLNKQPFGNKILYSLNREHIYFFPLLDLLHKSRGLGGQLVRDQKKFPEADYLVLTSYFLFNNRQTKYDVDLLIIGKVDIDRIGYLVDNAEKTLDREILYTVLPPKEFEYRKIQKDSFVWNILKNKYVVLKGDESKILS